MNAKVRIILTILTVAIGIVCLVWGFAPPGFDTLLIPLNAPNSSAEDLDKAANLWEIGIKAPKQLRLGETILMELWIKEKDSIDPGQSEEMKNLTAEYQPIVQARLELSGADFAPQGQINQAMLKGKVEHFYWQVQPIKSGMQRGTLWLHILYAPLTADGLESQRLLLAYPLEVPVHDLIGLGILPVQVIGIVVTIIGSAFLILSIRAWLLSRRKQSSPRSGKC